MAMAMRGRPSSSDQRTPTSCHRRRAPPRRRRWAPGARTGPEGGRASGVAASVSLSAFAPQAGSSTAGPVSRPTRAEGGPSYRRRSSGCAQERRKAGKAAFSLISAPCAV
eukprot:scaffold2738_cov366-Prasinococcus_capsulatus_cf.AAC.11